MVCSDGHVGVGRKCLEVTTETDKCKFSELNQARHRSAYYLRFSSIRSSPPEANEEKPTAAPGRGPNKEPQRKFKNRVESWLKDAEEDAQKAEKYLDKRKQLKKSSTKEMVEKTDVIRAMEAVEKESTTRKKTPPTSETERKKQLIRY